MLQTKIDTAIVIMWQLFTMLVQRGTDAIRQLFFHPAILYIRPANILFFLSPSLKQSFEREDSREYRSIRWPRVHRIRRGG